MSRHLWARRSMAGGLLAAVMVLAACGGSSSPAAGQPTPAGPGPGAPVSPKADQIVILGAVSNTFTPIKVEAGTLGSSVVINLYEKTVGGISLTFPADTPVGVYPIEDHLNKPVVDVFAEYDVFGAGSAMYLSTKGTLTLTAAGSKYSGKFEFTAGLNKDATKIIEVTGTFNDVPLTP